MGTLPSFKGNLISKFQIYEDVTKASYFKSTLLVI